MNDKDFYLTLYKMFEEMKERIIDCGAKEIPHITIWIYDTTGPEIVISSGYSTTETKVTGKEFSVIVDEYLRRLGFNNQQKVLQIAPPVVENEPQEFPEEPVEINWEKELNDEIPF